MATELGHLYDDLANLANDHAVLSGIVGATEKFYKSYHFHLARMSEGSSQKEREAVAWSIIHEGEDWRQHQADVRALAEFAATHDNLKTRVSICQSLLKRFEIDANAARFGQSAGQKGPS